MWFWLEQSSDRIGRRHVAVSLPLPGVSSGEVEGLRFAEVVALAVVGAVLREQLPCLLGADMFADRLDLHATGDLDDRFDQQPVLWVVGQVADEAAVDLDELNRYVLQVGERSKAQA